MTTQTEDSMWNKTARDCLPKAGVPVLVQVGKGKGALVGVAVLVTRLDGFGDDRPDRWAMKTPVHHAGIRDEEKKGWLYTEWPTGAHSLAFPDLPGDGEASLASGHHWMPLPEVADE